MKGSSRGDTLGFLGYCPQENALWPNLLVREHLEIFAAVKGMSKGDAAVAIARYTGVCTCLSLCPGDGEKAGGSRFHSSFGVEGSVAYLGGVEKTSKVFSTFK